MSFSINSHKPTYHSPNIKFSSITNSASPRFLKKQAFESKYSILASPIVKYANTSSTSPVLKTVINDFSSTKDLIWQEIQESLGLKSPRKLEKSFHKSKEFIERKQKIQKNVKEQKYKSSGKLRKLKSIIEFDDSPDLLTNDDLINGEGSHFLALNRRNFGESKNINPRFRSKRTLTLSEKINSRNPSLPDLPSAKSPRAELKYATTHRKSFESPISEPVIVYIQKEMKKMWPPDTELIHKKKQKILRVKMEKLSEIVEENLSNKRSKKRQLGDKLKMESKIDQHCRKISKKIKPVE